MEETEQVFWPPSHGESLFRRTCEIATEFVCHANERPVAKVVTPASLQSVLGSALPDEGEPADTVINNLNQHVQPGLVASNAGRYFGFVVGAAWPVSIAADWLVSAWDQNAGFYVLSPAAAVIEKVTAGWIKNLLGLPDESAVGFVTGCQMANLMALASARQSVLDRVGWDVALQGLHGAPRLRVLTSAEAHGTIDRALAVLGVGADTAHRIPCDDQGRLDVTFLRDMLMEADNPQPTIVAAQAGNVDTGSFDRFQDIAETCRKHDAWLHVDGAFGLWAAASRKHRHLTEGIHLADSWATDAHKWLNVPYDSGIVIVRDGDALVRSTRYRGDYLVRTQEIADPCTFTPESSRRARAIPIYAALRFLGKTGVESLVDRCCANATLMAQLLSEGGLQVLNDVVLNQVLFRCPTPHDDKAFHDRLIGRIQRDGTCWLGGTTRQGRPAMRISVCSFQTSREDIERSAGAILRCLALEIAAAGDQP